MPTRHRSKSVAKVKSSLHTTTKRGMIRKKNARKSLRPVTKSISRVRTKQKSTLRSSRHNAVKRQRHLLSSHQMPRVHLELTRS